MKSENLHVGCGTKMTGFAASDVIRVTRVLTLSLAAVFLMLWISPTLFAQTYVQFHTNVGDIDVQLLPNSAPLTVANFLRYVDRSAYDGSFVHRSVPNFVIQGGGFKYDGVNTTTVPTDPPVFNEFNLSNIRGTLAMAKLGSDPNSATSQWFFNTVDNSAILDTQNGGYTVFGRIVGNSGLTNLDRINAIPVFNLGSLFDQIPLINYTSGPVQNSNLVTVYSVSRLTSNTSTGSNVTIQAGESSVTYSNVSIPGTTSFAPIDTSSAGPLPSGYTLCASCVAYDITTTATYTPPVNVCLAVPASISSQTFLSMALLHSEGGILVDRTTGRFTDGNGNRTVCGSVSSLSPFLLAQGPGGTPTPTPTPTPSPTPNQSTCAPAPIGLISAWSGDGNALDARSRSNGTNQGNVTYAAGEVGQGFNFGGANGDRVLIGNPTNLRLQNFTIETWIKRSSSSVVTNSPNAGSPDGIFFAYGLGGYAFLVEQNTNKLGLSLVGSSQVLAPTLAITDTNWHHVAVTFAGGQTVFYVDGVADAPVSYNVNYSFTSNAAIGSRGDGQTDNVFFGAIDELGIYNRPLASSEIQAIYNANTTGKCKPLATYAPENQVLWLAGDGDLRDMSGNGNNGSYLSGTSSAFAIGKVGQGFQFDGTVNSEINVPDSQSLRPTTAVTVEAWVNPSSVGTGFQDVVFKGNGGSASGQPYSIFLNGPTHLITVRVGNDSTFDQFTSVSGIPANVYSHIAFSYDGTTVRIYTNGVLDSSFASSIGGLAQADTNVLWVGGLGSSFAFLGGIDEVGIFNRALSLSEIQSITNAGIAGKYKVQSTVPENIAAWYPGDGDTNDIQGGNNAILQNGATYGNGKVGQGFQFDGADDQISIPHNSNQNGVNNLTIEAWINPTSLAHGTTILQKRTNGNVGGYLLEPTQPSGNGAANGLQFVIMIGGVYQTLNPANIVTTNVWQHVAATYDGAFMRLYVNGVEVGSRAQTGVIDAENAPVVIGRNVVNGNTFDGRIDEIGLYNRALTANEIRDIYYTQAGGKYKGSINPIVSNKTTTGDATVTFGSVTSAGSVHQTPLNVSLLPPLPMGAGTDTGLDYDISTSAAYTNPTTCFNLPSFSMTQFSTLKIYHLESGTWVNRTAAGNTYPSLCSSGLTSLSPFAIVQAAPTAAEASLSGRVLTSEGRGLRSATVMLTDQSGNSRTAITGPLGNYVFTGIEAGQTYVIAVQARRFQFTPRVIQVNDDLTNVDFIPEQ